MISEGCRGADSGCPGGGGCAWPRGGLVSPRFGPSDGRAPTNAPGAASSGNARWIVRVRPSRSEKKRSIGLTRLATSPTSSRRAVDGDGGVDGAVALGHQPFGRHLDYLTHASS